MSEYLNYIPRLQQQYNEVIQKELLSMKFYLYSKTFGTKK